MDSFRRLVRERIGSDSLLYRQASRALNWYFVLRRGGCAGIRVLAARRSARGNVSVQLPPLLFPISFRPESDDVSAIVNNIFREEYGQLPEAFSPSVIVDAGAYIGDTAAYFLSRFKMARVIALEPNATSFSLASENLAPYGERATLIQGALWGRIGTVAMVGQQTGFSITAEGGNVVTLTMPELMKRFAISQVDLLKMDIEGAEMEVLRSGRGAWLQHIRCLLLETHGDDIERAVLPIMLEEGFAVRRHRNVWYCWRNKD